jgi:hypothetical protein
MCSPASDHSPFPPPSPSPAPNTPTPPFSTDPDSLTPSSRRLQPNLDHCSTMKDITSHVSSKPSRNSFYFKKRPSPHGVAKSRRTPVSLALSTANCRVVGSAQHRMRIEMQRQRELQALMTARDTSLLEEEYRTEVLKYMHDMEVSKGKTFLRSPVLSTFRLLAMHYVLRYMHGPAT